jgi:hypothetical protein
VENTNLGLLLKLPRFASILQAVLFSNTMRQCSAAQACDAEHEWGRCRGPIMFKRPHRLIYSR